MASNSTSSIMPLLTLPDDVTHTAWNSSSSRLALASHSGTLHVWAYPPSVHSPATSWQACSFSSFPLLFVCCFVLFLSFFSLQFFFIFFYFCVLFSPLVCNFHLRFFLNLFRPFPLLPVSRLMMLPSLKSSGLLLNLATCWPPAPLMDPSLCGKRFLRVSTVAAAQLSGRC